MSLGKQFAMISAANRAAMVNKGYCDDQYAKLFVDKVVSYSPIVHKYGFLKSYCMESIIVELLLFARAKRDPVKQIVVLGSGFSTLYMRLRDDGFVHDMHGITKYVEVDLKDILIEKKKLMENNKLIKKSDKEVYQMIAADFKVMKNYLFKELVNHASVDYPTLIIADSSLIFAPSKISDRILLQISGLYDKCYCVLVEPFNMYDVFGHFTMKYFRDFHYSLESPMKYSTMHQIKERIKPLFQEVLTVEMKHAMRELIHPELYSKISKLDLFNEYEELYHLNSHQAFTIATKSLQLPEVFSKIPGNLCQCCSAVAKWDFHTELTKIPIYKEFDMGFTTFRHCSAIQGSNLLIVGGFGKETAEAEALQKMSCLNMFATFNIKDQSLNSTKVVRNQCWKRLNASMDLCKNKIVIFGGKDGSLVLNDLITVDLETIEVKSHSFKQWDTNYPAPRYRHASCMFSRTYKNTSGQTEYAVVVDGGRNFARSFDDTFSYLPADNKWKAVKRIGVKLPPRHSHSICTSNNSCFYLTGGLINDSELQINTYLYSLEFSEPTQCVVSVRNKNMPPVFGHTSHIYKCKETHADWLVLVGGIVPYCPYSLVTFYDLINNCLKCHVRVGGDCLMSNHTSHIFHNYLLIVGGGGFMSNYGSFLNEKIKSYSITDMTAAAKESDNFPFLESALESQQIARHMRKLSDSDEDEEDDSVQGSPKNSRPHIKRSKYLGHEIYQEVNVADDKKTPGSKKGSGPEKDKLKRLVPEEQAIGAKELYYKKVLSDIEKKGGPNKLLDDDESKSKSEKLDNHDRKTSSRSNKSGKHYKRRPSRSKSPKTTEKSEKSSKKRSSSRSRKDEKSDKKSENQKSAK